VTFALGRTFSHNTLRYRQTDRQTATTTDRRNTVRYDTIEEINVDSKAEYTA